MPIHLQPWHSLSPAQQSQVRTLSISPEQIEYAGAVEKQLASVEAEPSDDLVGLCILEGEEAIGFLVLKRGAAAPEWAPPNSVVISGMRIDQARQGGGVGSHALILLPAWLQANWPTVTDIALSVDEENSRGIKAYGRAGFVDWGQRVAGRIGWVRYMSRPVMASSGSDT